VLRQSLIVTFVVILLILARLFLLVAANHVLILIPRSIFLGHFPTIHIIDIIDVHPVDLEVLVFKVARFDTERDLVLLGVDGGDLCPDLVTGSVALEGLGSVSLLVVSELVISNIVISLASHANGGPTRHRPLIGGIDR
jgi:hypothetical protein